MSRQNYGGKLDINNYYKQMLPDDVIMSYKGAPSEELLNSILTIAEVKLSAIEQHAKLKKKVYHILIEVIQNIHHHLEFRMHQFGQDVSELANIVFIFSRLSDGGYEVITGNYLPTNTVGNLKQHLDAINKMSEEELKNYYRKQLNNGEMSPKGGAGLGILDIARRSGEPLDYDFKDCANGNSFFSLKVKILA